MTELSDLLKAYGDVLINTEQGPRYRFIRIAQGWIMGKIKIPIARSFVTYLLVVHLNNVLEYAKHTLRLQLYTAPSPEKSSQYQDSIKTLDDFQKVVPKIPYKLLIFVYAVIIILIGQNTFTNANDVTFANSIMLSLLKLDVKGFLDCFNGVKDQSIFWRLPLFWIMILGFLAYPVYTSFIYKRILFNVYPNIDLMNNTHMTDYFDSMLGVYELEHRFFKLFGIESVNETPIDLIVFELVYVFGLCCGLLPAYIAITTGITFWYYVAVPNIVISVFMMIKFYMTKKARYGTC